jgi:hypothetical protein
MGIVKPYTALDKHRQEHRQRETINTGAPLFHVRQPATIKGLFMDIRNTGITQANNTGVPLLFVRQPATVTTISV